MIYHYTLTPQKLKKATPLHLNHRFPIRRYLLPTLGILYLLGGLILLLNHIVDPTLSIIMLILGLAFLIRRPILIWKMTKNAFLGKKPEINISLTILEDHLILKSEHSESTISWESFVDLQVCPDGMLLYSQKLIYMWIPNDGRFEKGSWETFTHHFSQHITPKI